MRTYKLTIAYDGTRYQGWQRQPDTELTIQGTLERTIRDLKGVSVEVHGSGRTDGAYTQKPRLPVSACREKWMRKYFRRN